MAYQHIKDHKFEWHIIKGRPFSAENAWICISFNHIDNKSTLIHVIMAPCDGTQPLPEPMLTKITDAFIMWPAAWDNHPQYFVYRRSTQQWGRTLAE